MKIVYFDEDSASDYLDITAGGKETSTSESVIERSRDTYGKADASLGAKFNWLPFLGASTGAAAGAGVSALGKSLISRTISNTILTDYLNNLGHDDRLHQLRNCVVTAVPGSMAYVKMFTPYMVLLKRDDLPFHLDNMDAVLATAKGYFELLGEDANGYKCVLRFNLLGFRNNYGLTDLGRMRLVFHGIHVGETTENSLSMEAEMSGGRPALGVTAAELVDRAPANASRLDVFDVILAGVEVGR